MVQKAILFTEENTMLQQVYGPDTQLLYKIINLQNLFLLLCFEENDDIIKAKKVTYESSG